MGLICRSGNRTLLSLLLGLTCGALCVIYLFGTLREPVFRTTAQKNAFPMTPVKALSLFGDKMLWWERYEILHYTKVWFLGLDANKTQINEDSKNNFGFDEELDASGKGRYKLVAGDHIAYRYEIVKHLNSGGFGSMVHARDWSHPDGMPVALKVMHKDDSHDWYGKYSREIAIMNIIEKNAKNQQYFAKMLATFDFRNHRCLVFELLGPPMDLYARHNMTLFRMFAKDILRGMYYSHEIKVIHGDLKPNNIMYVYGKNNKSSGQLLKIVDFGTGSVQNSETYKWTPFIQCRYYRAPEVILQLPYTTALDMWSVGIVFAQLFLGFAPISEGRNNKELLANMIEVLGPLPENVLARSDQKKFYDAIMKANFQTAKNGIQRKVYGKPLRQLLNGMEPALFDLVSRLLQYDPKERISAEQALRHSFITGVQTGKPSKFF